MPSLMDALLEKPKGAIKGARLVGLRPEDWGMLGLRSETSTAKVNASLEKNRDKPCSVKGCGGRRHISSSGKVAGTLCTYHQREKEALNKEKQRIRLGIKKRTPKGDAHGQ